MDASYFVLSPKKEGITRLIICEINCARLWCY